MLSSNMLFLITQGNMLLWQESDGRDLALSFLNSLGLDDILRQIKQVRLALLSQYVF